MLSVILEDAAVLLQTILRTEARAEFICVVPPGVREEVPDIESQFLGLGFPGVYIGLESEDGVLVHVGVVSMMTEREPPHAYFGGGRSPVSKAVVACFAIAVARLVNSPIQDGSGHWMPRGEFSPEELMAAMAASVPSSSDASDLSL